MTAAAADDFIPDAEDAPFVPDAEPAPAAAPPADDRGFLARAWDHVVGGVHAVAHVGKDLAAGAAQGISENANPVFGAVGGALGVLKDPAKRRELERGVDDVVTLGHGQRLAATLENTAAGQRVSQALGVTDGGLSPEQAEKDAAAAPEYRTAGQTYGMALPNPVSKIVGPLASKAVSPLAKAFEGAIGSKIVDAASKIPFAGPAAATLAAGAGGAARGAAEYELTAPIAAAASAGAEGHRLEAAREAAADPAGLLLSAGTGAVASVGRQAAKEAAGYTERARAAANEWIAKDLQGEVKGASTPTARRQMMRAADNFPDLIGRDQELRDSIADARHGSAAKIAKAEELVSRRLDDTQEPKADLYKKADAALPKGGVRVGDVVAGYQKAIDDLEATGLDLDAQVAGELKGRLNKITGARDWGAEKTTAGLSEKAAADLKTLETVRKNMEGRPGFDPKAIDEQIAAIHATGKPTVAFNPDHIVSTRQLRRLVTDAQRTAFDREGGINGTERYNRAIEVAAVPEKILDEHLGHAAEKAPDVVSAIETMDRDTHTLLAAKKVLVQRLDHARLNAQGTGGIPTVPHSLKQLAHGSIPLGLAATAYTGHPGMAAIGAATIAAPMIKRVIDTSIAKFASTPQGERVVARLVHAGATGGDTAAAIEHAIAAGVPPRVAQRIADISRQTFAAQRPDDTTAEASP